MQDNYTPWWAQWSQAEWDEWWASYYENWEEYDEEDWEEEVAPGEQEPEDEDEDEDFQGFWEILRNVFGYIARLM